MAHRSVRLAKRPGPHNSRDASSTTLRAIVGPLRLLVCFFPPRTNSFLPRRDPRRRLLDASRAAREETDDWNRLFQRNARIKHSTPRVVSGNKVFTNLENKKSNFILHRWECHYTLNWCVRSLLEEDWKNSRGKTWGNWNNKNSSKRFIKL